MAGKDRETEQESAVHGEARQPLLVLPGHTAPGAEGRRGEAEGKRGQQLLLTAARLVLATREVEMVVKQQGGGWGTTGPA